MEGKDPKWRPVVCKGEMAPCRSEEGESWDGRDQLLCFRGLPSFFKHVQKGFPGLSKSLYKRHPPSPIALSPGKEPSIPVE